MAETDVATAITFSNSTAVTVAVGAGSETDVAAQIFNPLYGYWLSDVMILTGLPVTASAVRWTASTPAGTSVTVETSIDNGITWDLAAQGQPVPRLLVGDTVTQTVLARVTLSRDSAATTSPKVSSFQLAITADAHVDELVPVGVGMIDSVTVHATAGTTGSGSTSDPAGSTAVVGHGGGQAGGGVSIKVHAVDLSGQIKRNVWQMPYTVPAGLLYTDAIKAMVLDRLPSQTDFHLYSTTRITPLLVYGVQQGGDPWQDILELAQAIGFEAFFDAAGVFVCRPVPDPRIGVPVWQFDEDAKPLVAEAERQLSSEQTFNDIVVVGQGTSTTNPFSAEAFDNNPASPTYILGPYGRVTQRLTFSLITSQDQAQDTANAALFNSLGAADTVTLTVPPMPALEPGDVIKIVCSNVNANGTYMINSMTVPLSAKDPMQLTCFRQSTT
jgi:hypothetical protein